MSTIPVRLRRGTLAAIMAQGPYEPGEPVVDWTNPLSPVIYVADRDGVLRSSVVGPHGHEIADITGLSAALLGKTDVGHGHAVADITGLDGLILGLDQHIALKADAAHDHTIANVTGLATALSGLSDDIAGRALASHGHAIADVADLGTTLSDLNDALAGKAASGHIHTTAQVTGLDTALSGKAAASHGHMISSIINLSSELSGKAASVHGHSISQITGLEDALAAAGGGSGGGFLGPVAEPDVVVFGNTALVNGSMGKMHHLYDVPVTPVAYTVTLPPKADNIGKLIALRLDRNMTKFVTIAGYSGEQIDTLAQRVLCAGESVVLLCVSAGWTKVAGTSIPMSGQLYNSASALFAAGTATKIAADSSDWGNLADPANQRLVVGRTGRYILLQECVMNNTNATATYVEMRIYLNGSWVYNYPYKYATAQLNNLVNSKVINLAAGTTLETYMYYSSGSFTTSVVLANACVMSLLEQPSW